MSLIDMHMCFIIAWVRDMDGRCRHRSIGWFYLGIRRWRARRVSWMYVWYCMICATDSVPVCRCWRSNLLAAPECRPSSALGCCSLFGRQALLHAYEWCSVWFWLNVQSAYHVPFSQHFGKAFGKRRNRHEMPSGCKHATYTRMCIFTYIHIYIYMIIYLCIHTHIYIYIYIYTYMHTYIHTYIHNLYFTYQ